MKWFYIYGYQVVNSLNFNIIISSKVKVNTKTGQSTELFVLHWGHVHLKSFEESIYSTNGGKTSTREKKRQVDGGAKIRANGKEQTVQKKKSFENKWQLLTYFKPTLRVSI